MVRAMAIAGVLTCVILAGSARAEEKTITLPADHDYAKLKPGPHRDLAQTQCQFCHSTDYIVMQPKGDAKQWDAVVTKMIKVFGAPLSEADAKAITEYLATTYGPAK
jgi:sulfite dehydrogenase (cytochrome) subunit B